MVTHLEPDTLECEVKRDLGSFTKNKASGGDGISAELLKILKEISPEYSLKGLMMKLKLQYFGHLMQRVDLIGKDPDAGRDWGQEEKVTTEDEMAGWHHRLDGHESE